MKVVQSWDDGVVDDLWLTGLLRHYGATATFNLNPGLHQLQRSFSWKSGDKEIWRLGQSEMAAIYAGFEIASHSLTHPNLPDLSPMELERQVGESRRILQDWFQQPVLGFCYPFGSFNSAVKEVVRTAGHVYARTVQYCDSVFPPVDPFEFGVSCWFADPAFWTLYERAKAGNGVFFFWGHSYELVNDAMWADLEHKIAGISADPAVRWASLEGLFAG